MKKLGEKPTLDLGPDVVRRLLPHRRPFLLVDRVTGFSDRPRPTLHAQRYISQNEPIFEGHFPDLALWPGVYTIEGLGQAVNILVVITAIRDAVAEQGGDPEQVLEALSHLQRGYRLTPGYDPDDGPDLLKRLPAPRNLIGMAAHVDVRLVAPVFAGSRLDYEVSITAELDALVHCEVEARVDGQTVARGRLISQRRAGTLPT